MATGGAQRSARQLTTSNGAPVEDNQNSLSAGPNGPLLLQDFHLIDKLAHFDRERIPERVVHAKGSGAHGYLEGAWSCTARQRGSVRRPQGGSPMHPPRRRLLRRD